MSAPTPATPFTPAAQPLFLPHAGLQALLDRLGDCGYQTVGPQLRDEAVVYDALSRAEQLPWGISDEQEPVSYRLQRQVDAPLAFAWSNGVQAIKPHLFLPRESLWRVTRDPRGKLAFEAVHPHPQRLALFGVRPCDLRAMQLQDRLFVEGRQPDPRYAARRLQALLIVVNCTHSSSCCFCVSAGGGPAAERGFDLVMTELDKGFVVTAGSRRGADVLPPLQLEPASPAQIEAASELVALAAARQTRTLPPAEQLRSKLFEQLNHPQWDAIAERCLSCGACTMVCPSCFCHAESDETEPGGKASTHYRSWDSCFDAGHSYVRGHVLRASVAKRYRQWLSHKLASWQDQFGSSGCVGCGRCISACPAGIDITAEATILCKS